ncbi:hypothetical protein HYU45_01205 [Candidatus Daviesbacteria bacterium]|nr:hypothetical protein [Candidatus Daviesbacteria bacterium]
MFKIILKIFPSLFFWGSFTFVVLQVPYPESLTQANAMQIFPFFLSLYLALVFTLNIFLKNILFSSSVCLGLVLLLILKALNSLNIITGALVIIATGLLASYFRKTKRKGLNPIKSDLTKLSKIPKLTKLQ